MSIISFIAAVPAFTQVALSASWVNVSAHATKAWAGFLMKWGLNINHVYLTWKNGDIMAI